MQRFELQYHQSVCRMTNSVSTCKWVYSVLLLSSVIGQVTCTFLVACLTGQILYLLKVLKYNGSFFKKKWKLTFEKVNFICLYQNSLLFFFLPSFFPFLPFCSYNILDPEIFSLNNSGTVVVRESVENNRRTPTPYLLKKSPSGLTKKQTCKNF